MTALQEKRARLAKQHLSENAYRKKRTRTLIQVGGLVDRAGLLNDLGISPGDDLQKDPDALPKAAALFGALLEIKALLNVEPTHQKHLWEERGKEELGK